MESVWQWQGSGLGTPCAAALGDQNGAALPFQPPQWSIPLGHFQQLIWQELLEKPESISGCIWGHLWLSQLGCRHCCPSSGCQPGMLPNAPQCPGGAPWNSGLALMSTMLRKGNGSLSGTWKPSGCAICLLLQCSLSNRDTCPGVKNRLLHGFS